MNRRDFGRALTGAALGLAALSRRPARAKSAGGSEEAAVPFKLSVMLWTVFQDLPFEQRLEKVAEAGYRNVELVGEYHKWSEADYRGANRKRSELGITFDCTAGLEHGVGDPGAREAFLSDVRKELKLMEKIECPGLIVMSGDRLPGVSRATQHESCVEGLKRAADLVEAKNVKLLLENIDPEENPKYYLTLVEEGFEIIRKVNHPRVKFLYDFFHEQISGGNLIKKLEQNIGVVDTVHIADVPGRREPGTGEINYENIFKKLGQLKFSGYVAMEFLPLGDPVQSLRKAKEMALRAGRG